MRPKKRSMHLRKPTVCGAANPFYDWAYRKESPMIPPPARLGLRAIGQPSAPLLTSPLLNLNLGGVRFFANHDDSNQHRIQITTRDAFQNLRISGYIAYISGSPEPADTSTPTQFEAAAKLTRKSTFALRNSHYQSLAAHHPNQNILIDLAL